MYLDPALEPPVKGGFDGKASKGIINEVNWKDHLGDEKYYRAYLAFFTGLLLEKNEMIQPVLEEYIFYKDANVIPGKDGPKPLVISRFFVPRPWDRILRPGHDC